MFSFEPWGFVLTVVALGIGLYVCWAYDWLIAYGVVTALAALGLLLSPWLLGEHIEIAYLFYPLACVVFGAVGAVLAFAEAQPDPERKAGG